MPKISSMSSKDFVGLIEKAGAVFVRQGSTDHAIYVRIVDGKRYSAPVLMGKKTLDPNYKRVFRQLKLTDQEIGEVLSKK